MSPPPYLSGLVSVWEDLVHSKDTLLLSQYLRPIGRKREGTRSVCRTQRREGLVGGDA